MLTAPGVVPGIQLVLSKHLLSEWMHESPPLRTLWGWDPTSPSTCSRSRGGGSSPREPGVLPRGNAPAMALGARDTRENQWLSTPPVGKHTSFPWGHGLLTRGQHILSPLCVHRLPPSLALTLCSRHCARGIGQIQKNGGERRVQEVKVVKTGWLSSQDDILTMRSKKEKQK